MLIGEYQLNLSNDSRQEFVYLNSTPIATLKPQENYRVYADHLDTSRRVATNDDKARILWEWESKPFGESKATGTVSFNLRFPGQYFDAETSTHYNINRDYNPVTGRYIQSDPIGFDGGLNTYLYANGNSIMNIDTCGLWCWFGFIGTTCGNTVTYPKKLSQCDGNSVFAVIEERKKLGNGYYDNAFNAFKISYTNRLKYDHNLQTFALPCTIMAGGIVFKEALLKKVPKNLSGWTGLVITAVYNSKKERGINYEIRYMNNGKVEIWKTK
jgi:RHS repeat-associated protein